MIDLRRYTIVFIIALLICVAGTAVSAAPPSKTLTAITSATEAVETALAYTGFSELSQLKLGPPEELATLIVARDSITPFLADSVDGRTVWRVEIPNVILELDAWDPETAQQHPKDFVILLDSASGRLMSIRFWDSGKRPTDIREAPSKMAEDQMQLRLREKYLGFPTEVPPLSLLQVLDGSVFGSALTCRLGTVQYVYQTMRGREEVRPVWVVHLHGFAPFRGNITHMRTVVDAVTGENSSINMPSYTEPEENEEAMEK